MTTIPYRTRSGYKGDVFLRIANDTGEVILDSVVDYGSLAQNLPVKQAREIAQWILDNTEEPQVNVQAQFSALEIGDAFRTEGWNTIRVKISHAQYIIKGSELAYHRSSLARDLPIGKIECS